LFANDGGGGQFGQFAAVWKRFARGVELSWLSDMRVNTFERAAQSIMSCAIVGAIQRQV
jgi:hypothetical protein